MNSTGVSPPFERMILLHFSPFEHDFAREVRGQLITCRILESWFPYQKTDYQRLRKITRHVCFRVGTYFGQRSSSGVRSGPTCACPIVLLPPLDAWRSSPPLPSPSSLEPIIVELTCCHCCSRALEQPLRDQQPVPAASQTNVWFCLHGSKSRA